MKFDVAGHLKNVIDGSTIKDPDGSTPDIGTALMRALVADTDGDGNPLKGDEKVRRYGVIIKLAGKTEVDLTAEDIVLLKAAVLIFPTAIAGQLRDFLEIKS